MRATDRVRIRPTESRHPAVRDPLNSVGRGTHRIRSIRPSYDRALRGYPYRSWTPYYDISGVNYPWYWYHRPWYRYHTPWYWYSWYGPWSYPDYYGSYFYYGDWWWDGWGLGTGLYYEPFYDRPDEGVIEVTERVVDSGVPPAFASPDIAEAKRLFEKERYGEAAEMYRQVSLSDESNAFVRLAQAHCLLADKRYEYAAYVVRKTVGLDPDWEEIFKHLRGYYADWGIFVNQVVGLERYVAQRPDNIAARLLLGYAYLFWDRHDDAASVLRSLVSYRPQDNGARYFLSMVEGGEEKPETDS